MYVHACMLLQKGNELYYAAGTGNVAETKRLIQSGVYVDSTNEVSYKKVVTMHGYFKRNNTRRKFLRTYVNEHVKHNPLYIVHTYVHMFINTCTD